LVRNSRTVFIASKYGSRILRSLILEMILETHPLWKKIRVIFHRFMFINRGGKKDLTVSELMEPCKSLSARKSFCPELVLAALPVILHQSIAAVSHPPLHPKRSGEVVRNSRPTRECTLESVFRQVFQ